MQAVFLLCGEVFLLYACAISRLEVFRAIAHHATFRADIFLYTRYISKWLCYNLTSFFLAQKVRIFDFFDGRLVESGIRHNAVLREMLSLIVLLHSK